MRKTLVSLSIFTLCFIAQLSFADGVYVRFGPGGVVPMNNDDIQMVRETIRFYVPSRRSNQDGSKVVVSVKYEFRNHTTKSLQIDMGFPVGRDYREQYAQREGLLKRTRPNPISQFNVIIDGRKIPSRLVQGKKQSSFKEGDFSGVSPKNQSDIARKEVQNDPPHFDRYYVWKISFKPGQTKTVTNRYIYDTRAGIYEKYNELRYVLRTGAAWKGKIEEAVIQLDLSERYQICAQNDDDNEKCVKPVKIEGVKAIYRKLKKGRAEFRWKLKDIEPKNDIHFFYNVRKRK